MIIKDELSDSFSTEPIAEAIEMQEVLQEFLNEGFRMEYYPRITDLASYKVIRSQNAAYRSRLALATATMMQVADKRNDYGSFYALGNLLFALMRCTLSFSEGEYLRLFRLYDLDFDKSYKEEWEADYHLSNAFLKYPIGLTLSQLTRLTKEQGLGEAMRAFLDKLLFYAAAGGARMNKVQVKIQEILSQTDGTDSLPSIVFTNDQFGQHLTQFVQGLDRQSPAAGVWIKLLLHWQKASGAQPTAKFRKELDAAVAVLGLNVVRAQCRTWLDALAAMQMEEVTHASHYEEHTYEYTESRYLAEPSLTVAKGLVWSLHSLADEGLLQQLARLAVKCHHKVPGKGPLALGLGNACLLALARNGLAGVAHLSRLRTKVKQSNTQALIARHIEEASQALGVSSAEIEDMAVPDFGLRDGRAVHTLGEYTATLDVAEGKAEVRWEKAGKALKAPPAALKSTHAAALKELKNNQTQAQQTLTAQRERLDRSFVEPRRMAWPWFEQYYFRHGLLAPLVRPLIWRFYSPDGQQQDALWWADAWHDVHGHPLPAPAADTLVQLWHPVLSPPADVLAWRTVLEQRQLRQPLKQAFREVYLLTPPEERTNSYSNRMAAHMLKQHQFSSLARLRGWKYKLMGAYDKGYESDMATLPLPGAGLQAEFWVSEVNADDAWNDTGIYLYVSTDQVRLTRGGQPVPLPEVPPLVFSEVMRDVDLFVGVASVGNDPLWRDNGGLTAYRDYWESYSFGELGEVAKNRRLALERLVPRLKIGKVSEIKDKFLVVRGKLRTYKIHLGSGNILMEPNDQYLCIVPDRSAKTSGSATVFLPFEGDAVLSIILSKALLLMEDDQITDETINRQIRG